MSPDQTPSASPRWSRVLGVAATMAVLLAGLAATVVVVRYEHQVERRQLQATVDDGADEVADQLKTLLETQLGGAGATAAALSVDPELDRATFQDYASSLEGQLPTLLGVGYVRRVRTEDLPGFVAAVRADGAADFEAQDLHDGAEHAIIVYNEPADVLRTSWGVDLRSVPEASAALDRSTAAGRTVVTDPVVLAIDRALPPDRRPVGYVTYAPVFASGSDTGTPSARRANVVGWSNLPFHSQDLLDLVELPAGTAAVLRDGASVVASNGQWGDGDGMRSVQLVASPNADLVWTLEVTVPEPDAGTAAVRPRLAAIVGIVLTGLLAAAVGLISRSSSLWAGTASRFSRRLAESEAQLRARAAQLERSNRELESVATVAAHDLSEPLTVIGGYADLLTQRYPVGTTVDEGAAEHLGTISDAVGRMRDMLQALLHMASLRDPSAPATAVDLADVFRRATANSKASLEAGDAEIDIGPLPTVIGHRDLLVQLVQNLLTNAVRYRSTDRPLHIDVRAEQQGRWWCLEVSDNGIGVPHGQRDRIFQMFRRLDHETPGLGVGLSLAQRIVEIHGGHLTVEDTPGGGATFVVRLPAPDLPEPDRTGSAP